MNRFAAHLEMNFEASVPFRERWRTAAACGFAGCELVWRAHELEEVLELRAAYPLAVACLGGTSGFAPGGDRPVLVRPEDRERLAADTERAAAYAKAVGCDRLVFVPGNLDANRSLEHNRAEAVASLRYVAPILERAGVTAVLEPLNSKVDHKGIYCDTSEEAFRVVDAVGSPHVKMLYDVYHMQIMEGDLVRTIGRRSGSIGHYHIANPAGRVEPLGGEVFFPAVFDAIRDAGYDGFVGLEYRPSAASADAFAGLKAAYPDFFVRS